MGERDDVLEAIAEARVLEGFRWAFDSAASRAREDYSEDAGYDVGWFGYTRFTLLRDRLDRVFSCEHYAVPDGADGRASLDVVRTQLSQHDIDTMPPIHPGVVVRSNLNRSPGWAAGDYRLLLHSIPPGKGVNDITWPITRPTKRRVAQQPTVDVDEPTLFDGLAPEYQADIAAILAETNPLDRRTLVVAHAINPLTDKRELVLGQPRLNDGGGRPWHWTHDLLQTPPTDGALLRPASPAPSQPDGVPDAPVKLRGRARETGTAEAMQ
jgi:hypothetical protein